MARRGGKNKTARIPGGGKARKLAKEQQNAETSTSSSASNSKKNPLIAFFGQLSFDTTQEDLMDHIRTQLKETPRHKVSKKNITIRMLTDPKTKRSRGMAFVEIHDDDPEFLYALLKLHQTYLKGRRINVERSAGGRKNSESRQSKLEQYKKEQGEYFAQIVDNILQEFEKTGEIRKEELDEGVLTLCRRHSGPVVKAAITEYVEKGGRDMDNPSAYLTFLVAKFAKEGIHDEENTGKTKKDKNRGNSGDSSFSGRKRKSDPTGNDGGSDRKRSKAEWKDSSSLAKTGVDMSVSDNINKDSKNRDTPNKPNDLSKIPPSSLRGKGRGYMRNVRRWYT